MLDVWRGWWGEIHLSGTSGTERAGEVFVSQLLTWIRESSRRRPQMLTRFVWHRRSHQRHLLILGRSNLMLAPFLCLFAGRTRAGLAASLVTIHHTCRNRTALSSAAQGKSLREQCDRSRWSSTPCEGLPGEERRAVAIPGSRSIFQSRRTGLPNQLRRRLYEDLHH